MAAVHKFFPKVSLKKITFTIIPAKKLIQRPKMFLTTLPESQFCAAKKKTARLDAVKIMAAITQRKPQTVAILLCPNIFFWKAPNRNYLWPLFPLFLR